MANGKRILRLTAIVIALVGVLGFQLEAMGMLGSADEAAGRPDVIMIDTIAKLEVLEQSAAVFKHDAHTKALKDQGMSCESCHKKDAKGDMALTFNRLEGEGQPELTASELKDIYHDGCITCHVKSDDKGFKTGPMVGECRSCHQAKPEVTSRQVRSGMDNMLHFIHWDSKVIPADAGEKTNCGSCHKKKGEEDSWRFAADNAGKSTQEVFHNQCVTCHQTLIEKKAERSGPVQCASCHGTEEVAKRNVELAKDLKAMGGELPRLPRKQPDAVLMMPKAETPAPEKVSGMAYVAFDHKFHEGKVDNCLTCHTKGVNAKSDEMTFEALHDVKSDSSCIGCHAVEQKKPECAGCHASRPAAKVLSDASCVACHNVGNQEDGSLKMLAAAPKETLAAKAATVIAARPQSPAQVAVEDIPEFVNIGVISDKYLPSKMPHRKIVLSLMDGMKDSQLATAFHAAPEAICAGCHHNSPATKTPPKCASCHGKPFAVEGKPGLKAAYHGQCMSCHTEMKLEKPAATNCVACHEKKTN
ncbi:MULTISPECIES: sulfate respiration complex hexadecaheme cytochrome HmcA [unclassified Pseudodesulfovibrio]|uniref:sulfate respiration complex hexadecaheme cytochrome HmcA n=1 Tax=unclassified Pseudodesulfovibrio TaxID=2661612 RepID=UPI000FEC0931|nr:MULTISPECIES: cytochrome c3 family protein [unclassified Pseudodesulfovibrio]MCJ2164795.1 cytochrome c class III [Pseudodesulfovibrio sp. S3-i]RWU03833.1 cytochrome c class III [Pseudodesulfovibrio sp. S3]